MSLYLYGLLPEARLPSDAEIEALRGLRDAPLDVTRMQGFGIVHSAHDGGEILQTRRLMLAHTRVLEALMDYGPVLPMRFGLVASDEAELARLVAQAANRIAEAFAHIGGRVEVGLRISWPRAAALERLLIDEPDLAQRRDALAGRGPEAHFDRIELGRRVAEALDRRRGAAQRRLAARLVPFCADHVLRAPEEDVEALRMECLVTRGEEAALVAEADAAAAEIGFGGEAEPLIRLIGPVPPFNFVRLSLWPGEKAA